MAKFEKGRKCIVMRSALATHLIGTVVVLNEKWLKTINHGKFLDNPGWTTTPPSLDLVDDRELAFPERCLMPIDDPDINRELSAEDNTDIVREHVKALDPQFSVVLELDRIAQELDQLSKLAEQMLKDWEQIKQQGI